jgi:Carboxypeptidase regulatory-like domain/Pilus formation protein N terminal region
MRLARTLFLLSALAVAAQGQVRLSVTYQKRIEIALSGATAAYSLDPAIADASASNGMVEIIGKAPGTTNVIIVTRSGVQTLAVVVPVPPPSLPPGFEPPETQRQGETGSYEFRYTSDPGQITNSLEMQRTQGQSFDRFQLINANLFSPGTSTSAVGFPFLSYEISRPHRDLTFVDQTVANSPFTLDEYMVRGFHMREGDWQFHGGFTSVATFQGLFLATDRQYVAGASRSFKLNDSSSLQGNVFYFRNPDSLLGATNNGVAGTIVFRYIQKDKAHFLAETGVSHGMGFAMRGGYDGEKDHVTGSFRSESRSFASLAVNNEHGTFSTLDATHKFGSRLFASLDLNQSDFNLPLLQQNSLTTGGLLNFKLNRNFSLTSGASYSDFQSKVPLGPQITTVNVPAGIDFSSRHFGSGFQYQRTTNFDGSGGNDYAVNLRGSAGDFHGNAFFRHDVQVPTLAAVFSLIPGLQDALDRAGIVAETPDQLAELLRNSALLATLGFTTPFTVNLAPSRNDYGASLTWMGRSPAHRQLDLSYFSSDTELLEGKFLLTTATLSYAQRLNANNQIVASAALAHTANNATSETKPLFTVSLRHQFYTVPGFVLPGRHGLIEGHVFRDDESSGVYNPQRAAVGGVEVRLDGVRVTHSDTRGYYSFHHVPYGVHRVEAKFVSPDPFFYTTDSPATTDINNTVDFGINFAKGQIFGFVTNDAGAGVTGITIEVQGDNFTRRVETGGNGKFSLPGLPAGSYTVSTVPESYPPGYSLQTLEDRLVTLEPGKPARVEFTVKALRSVAGRVLVYDNTLLRPVPLAGATVRIQELSLETITAENGAYLFRNLPAGTYVIRVEYQGKEIERSVTLPEEPASLRDVDVNVGSR